MAQPQVDFDALRIMYSSDSNKWDKAFVDSEVEYREIGAIPKNLPYPKDNPYTIEKEKLGKKLFNDPKLSLSNQIACASCHDKELSFGDAKRLSFGHDRQTGNRNTPSIIMAAFGKEKFWDGRAVDLEAQALISLADKKEMAIEPQEAAMKLNTIQSYKDDFKEAFQTDKITPELIAKAIATYERGLAKRGSRFDLFINGNNTALSDKEIWGLHLFRTKARCMNCHNGAEFSDNRFHNIGLTYYGREYEDLGRYIITGDTNDIGKFKTPTLRGLERSRPYMHNGLFPSLRGILNLYNAGMPIKPTKEQENDPLFPKTDKLIKPLHLQEEELEALEAFLLTL